jgi:hypothetical protein
LHDGQILFFWTWGEFWAWAGSHFFQPIGAKGTNLLEASFLDEISNRHISLCAIQVFCRGGSNRSQLLNSLQGALGTIREQRG